VEQETLHSVFAWLNESIFGVQTNGYEIHLANRLWGHKDFRIGKKFVELLRMRYDADLEQVDFNGHPELTCRKINQWVEDQTAGRIADLISPETLEGAIQILLVNAVYFKGAWKEKFDEAVTKEDPFHLEPFNEVKVQMMHQQADFSYAETDEVQVIELPYGDGDLSMIVLLPKRVGLLGTLEAALSASNLDKWFSALVPQSVEVFLPKFRLNQQIALAKVLKSMGMVTAFDISIANFFGMIDPGVCMIPPLCISEVLHKSFVEVNEEGTEAAAATGITVELCSAAFHRPPPVPVFRADHPFVFLIRHNRSGSILFMGRVTDPQE
jgi:serpin B